MDYTFPARGPAMFDGWMLTLQVIGGWMIKRIVKVQV